jgi:hypothetical protein
MLSREKGQHYGEGHQKASQISTGLLPLVAALSREEAHCLPDLRPTRNAGHRFFGGPVLPGSGEHAGRQKMIVLVTKQLKYPL